MRWTRWQPAFTRRMASCGYRTRCASLCRCVRLVRELNDDVYASAGKAGEAAGEANPRRYWNLERRAAYAAHREAILRFCAFVGRGRFPDIRGLAYAEHSRAPATISVQLLPHASPILESGARKQKTAPNSRSKQLISLRKSGAGEGIRTLDPNLGKVVLYP